MTVHLSTDILNFPLLGIYRNGHYPEIQTDSITSPIVLIAAISCKSCHQSLDHLTKAVVFRNSSSSQLFVII